MFACLDTEQPLPEAVGLLAFGTMELFTADHIGAGFGSHTFVIIAAEIICHINFVARLSCRACEFEKIEI